jgi:hypothetical protein
MTTLTYAGDDQDSRTLIQLETTIEAGWQRAGLALREIRDRKLYLEAGYATFAAYLRDRWNYSRSRGYQLIAAAGVLTTLLDQRTAEVSQVTALPENERQARELAIRRSDRYLAQRAHHDPPPAPLLGVLRADRAKDQQRLNDLWRSFRLHLTDRIILTRPDEMARALSPHDARIADEVLAALLSWLTDFAAALPKE